MNEQKAKAIVLEWLTDFRAYYIYPVQLLGILANGMCVPSKVAAAYHVLEPRAEFELLAEFAAWGLKEGALHEQ